MKRIIFTAVNAVVSRDMLSVVPHRMVCDGIAVVYRYVEDKRFSNVITNEVAMELGYTEEQMHEMALTNLKSYLPVITKESDGVYSITSENEDIIGSSLVLMPGVLDEILSKTGEDELYVTVEPKKVTIATCISNIYHKVLEQTWNRSRIGHVMRYTKNGFALI